jgi:hypothetical protein
VTVGERRDDLDLRAQAEEQLERLAEDVVVLDERDADPGWSLPQCDASPPRRAGRCEARTQGAFVSSRYGRD